FSHAPGRRPIKEFRDSSLFTLEIENGIQFCTINVVEGKVKHLPFTRPGFELKAEYRGDGRIGSRVFGNSKHADKYLAVVNGLAQPDFDPLIGKPNEIGDLLEWTIRARRTDLKALVIDIFDLEYSRQLL